MYESSFYLSFVFTSLLQILAAFGSLSADRERHFRQDQNQLLPMMRGMKAFVNIFGRCIWTGPRFCCNTTPQDRNACKHTDCLQPDNRTMDMAKKPLRDLYPESEPYDSGWLQVSDIHKLSYQQYGNSKGKAAVFLHGGPGAGVGPCDHRFFDPEVYRVILFDQRGAGKSTPAGELKENTTWDLVEDIEKLRKHLNIDRWVVFGGSWGSALSLAYAQAHPSRVKALVLRGIFTVRRKELEWLYEDKGGACMVYPDCFAAYKNFIPHAEQKDLLHAYYRRLISDDEKVRIDAAKHYARWEMSLGALLGDEEGLKDAEKDEWSQQFSRIGCHYFINGGFFVSDTQLLDNVDKIRHIPATIVQGRYDIVCPTETAWLLHKCWPEAEFFIVQDAGHLAYEPGITSRLVEAADKYKSL